MTVYLTDYRTASTNNTELLEDLPYPQKVHRFSELWKNKDSGLIYVPHKMAEKVLDVNLLKELRDTPKRCAFILAAGNSHFAGLNPKDAKPTCLTYDYKMLPLTLTQVYAGRVAQMCGATDLVITDASACASSLKVMTDVKHLIHDKNFERVIVLSIEDAISDMVLKFFGETGACLTWEEEQKGILPSAFDKQNRGFYVGQGAVFAVFEDEYTERKPQAILHGAGIGSEKSTNAIGQLADGSGFYNAMDEAFDDANMLPREIKIIKTHGTGTLSNNESEYNALNEMFDTEFYATSYKQRIGHTMGVSGLLESCLMLDDLKQKRIPKILNRTSLDTEFLSDDIIIRNRNPMFLSLAAGMGNIYAAAIFETL